MHCAPRMLVDLGHFCSNLEGDLDDMQVSSSLCLHEECCRFARIAVETLHSTIVSDSMKEAASPRLPNLPSWHVMFILPFCYSNIILSCDILWWIRVIVYLSRHKLSPASWATGALCCDMQCCGCCGVVTAQSFLCSCGDVARLPRPTLLNNSAQCGC